ncbi:hypothetical protein BH10PSE18_BH10PSE18_38010 [soil metagenome]|jgi:branched-subunit amino acid transport protein
MSTALFQWLAVFALAATTVLTRSMFLLPRHAPRFPLWLQNAMRHAPPAALLALVVPQVLLSPAGTFITDWRDARLFAVAAACLCHALRRSVTLPIVVGSLAYFPLHVGWGW